MSLYPEKTSTGLIIENAAKLFTANLSGMEKSINFELNGEPFGLRYQLSEVVNATKVDSKLSLFIPKMVFPEDEDFDMDELGKMDSDAVAFRSFYFDKVSEGIVVRAISATRKDFESLGYGKALVRLSGMVILDTQRNMPDFFGNLPIISIIRESSYTRVPDGRTDRRNWTESLAVELGYKKVRTRVGYVWMKNIL